MVDKKVNQHSVTLDQVLKAVNNLAEKTDSRFDEMGGILQNHNKRFDSYDKRFDAHEKKFDEILAAISSYSGETDRRFNRLEIRVDNIENRITTEMATKSDLEKLESRMVSKSYLDDKLADVISEIGVRINRLVDKGTDFKYKLVGFLDDKAILDKREVTQLRKLI